MSTVKKSILCAVCIALCVVLPQAFHAVLGAGQIYLPMHIPVLLCGLICGWQYGLLCGLAGPALSSLFTGMPPVGFLPSMMIELAIYGLMTGILMDLIRTGRTIVDLYLSLIGAMLVGRIVSGILRATIFSGGSYSIAAWTTSYFVTGAPGILIQLAIIPALVLALMKAGLIPGRNKKDRA